MSTETIWTSRPAESPAAPISTTTPPCRPTRGLCTAATGRTRPPAPSGPHRDGQLLPAPRRPGHPADDDPDLLVYTRESGANQLGLQDKLARLDHGEAAAVFATGMAALHATFFTVLNPGDHAIVSNVVYMRTHGLFSSLLPAKLGIEVDLVDITDLDAVRAAVRPNTRLIHTEVIANPDLRSPTSPHWPRSPTATTPC